MQKRTDFQPHGRDGLDPKMRAIIGDPSDDEGDGDENRRRRSSPPKKQITATGSADSLYSQYVKYYKGGFGVLQLSFEFPCLSSTC